ncbi:hypothetical protein OAN93_00715 [Candidatus Marinimicrobia bacterium]|jgi:hypothetical protein|nr:hypothetical protein [Candidatus Neomarinimicrobiota bacterium]MDA9841590.1 hypothetical protein [Candidatus Neomarinimicrobiota bacterium]MDB3980166.1 hypothetical protein [Candidatus Neomarinimicrobiota bacterium]MDC0521270.1 hypothetical protein [Candidatus Neomarinimicrobiota bacterium]MDC0878448.1 hypothetical protein [Candidatus Neomarinimicrobiota bacterium]|tara:strand:+ start:542 stop:745 length:204 start_codon:yes stop_codon:yes gene_type:complete
MEKLGYILILAFYVYMSYLIINEIETFFPEGLLVILICTGAILLFIKVLRERWNNKEDDYYSKEIDK